MTRPRPDERVRALVLAVVCVLYPAATYAFPAMGRAWGMYASTATYRLRATARDENGAQVDVPLGAVVRDASPRVASALVGADRWRHGSVLSLPTQLARVGRYACRPGLAEVTLELEWRTADGAPSQTERVVVPCTR